jgi:asparagine synthetase B (glutamine-hydrolysing)
MDFLLKYNLNQRKKLSLNYCENIITANLKTNVVFVEKLAHLDYIELTNDFSTQYALGDIINSENEVDALSDNKGIFYLLTLTENNTVLYIKSDDHGLLPIYFMEQDNFIYISSSFLALSSILRDKSKNPDFYPGLAILYTQMNRATYYNGIKRLEYGEIIELDGSIKIARERRFYDFFTSSPKPFKSSINDIADLFIDISRFYVREPCAISLTGGFDGRTITGCAHHYNSDFINFSYGRKGNGDVDNPVFIANQLGLKYNLIELEQPYIDSEYIKCVESYIKYSGGLNGFQYPQSIYSAKLLASPPKIIVTGYLGSEILANTKKADDEVCPESVLGFLKTGMGESNYAYSLCGILTQLGIVHDSNKITDIMDRMEAYFLQLPKQLSINQKFAVFAFENIYRNTFGTWIYDTMHFAKVRVPFIDKEFFKCICETKVSQFYREFLESRPSQRMYGQMLYPLILNKVWPELSTIISSKGYSPNDILTKYGQFKIAFKRLTANNNITEKHGLDKMATITGATSYLKNINLKNTQILIDKAKLISLMQESPINRLMCFLAFSKIESARLLDS